MIPVAYEQALQAWAAAALAGLGPEGVDVLVIYENQSAPRPTEAPYVTLRVEGLEADGQAERRFDLDGEELQEVLVTHYTGRAVFLAYGSGAMLLALRLEQAVGRVDLRRETTAQVVVRAPALEGPVDATARRGAGFEERARLVLAFGWQDRAQRASVALAQTVVAGTLEPGEVETSFTVDLEEE